MLYKSDYTAFKEGQKRTFTLGVFANKCNPSGGPPAGYEFLLSHYRAIRDGHREREGLIRQRGSSLISSVPVSQPMS